MPSVLLTPDESNQNKWQHKGVSADGKGKGKARATLKINPVLKSEQALLLLYKHLFTFFLFPFISDYWLRSHAILSGLFFYYGLIFLLEAETYVNHLLILLDT